jgi:ABC-type sugar transport system permease subunit
MMHVSSLSAVSLFLLSPYLSGMLLATFPSIVTVVHALVEPCLSINGTLKVFDSVLALTNGGPGQVTTPLTLDMYNTAFANGQYGYGSTLATALAILCLIVTLLIFSSARSDVA